MREEKVDTAVALVPGGGDHPKPEFGPQDTSCLLRNVAINKFSLPSKATTSTAVDGMILRLTLPNTGSKKQKGTPLLTVHVSEEVMAVKSALTFRGKPVV